MHLQCACAPSVNRSSVLNCFHPLAVAAIVARGVSCQTNHGLCFRFSTPHPQRLRNEIKTVVHGSEAPNDAKRNHFQIIFFLQLMAVLLAAQYVTAAL